nr:MAG TPA: hypothetical protein [Caudoviricetes sp.]
MYLSYIFAILNSFLHTVFIKVVRIIHKLHD